MPAWLVIFASLCYLALLFAVAWRAERFAGERPLFARLTPRAGVYALALAVHNTTWSFYGAVGRAATSAFANLPTYVGITLFLILGQGLLRRIVVIAKSRNITSISDFIGARYDQSRAIAAFITAASLVCALPYLALQFKAVGFSFEIVTGDVSRGEAGFSQTLGAPDFWGATLLALFTMMIGVRHIHASERHRGFVLALALESVVKLAAFIAVALFAVYGVSGGVGDLLSQARADPGLANLLEFDFSSATPYALAATAFLSFLCAPQIFHIAVVENDGADTVQPAAWLYIGYMALFVVFVTPMAIAGRLALGPGVNPDTFTIAIPVQQNAPILALVAFIGGLSAATGMMMVAIVALSTMLCNDIVVPLLLRLNEGRSGPPMVGYLLAIRRMLVLAVTLLAFMTNRLIDARTPLMQMGILSFVAFAQFAPAFLGGLLWRKATGRGAISGMALGLAIWFYALLLPSVADVLGLPPDFARAGPFGVAWLSSYGLFAFGALDPISHATLWSLLLNCTAFVSVSLATPVSEMARERTLAFCDGGGHRQSLSHSIERVGDLAELAARFAGRDFVEAAFRRHLETRAGASLASLANDDDVAFTESLIAGAVGGGTARVVMAAALRARLEAKESASEILAEATNVIQFGHGLLQAITENVQQGICAFDAELRVLAWNRRFLTMLGLPDNFMYVGRPLSELVAYNQSRGEYASDDLARLFINNVNPQQTWPYIYERSRPNGMVFEVAFNRLGEGGFVATYSDVTERKRAAVALQAANEQLEARVAARTAALEEAKLEAEKANASKTRFLAAASHDLQQPLTAARLFLSVMQEDLSVARPEAPEFAEVRKNLESAAAALQSTEHLMDELLYVSTLDARAVKAEVATFSVDAIFSQLEREFAPLAARKGLRLRVVHSHATVATDSALLRRVLQNFLSNAIRYTSKGSVLLGCRRWGDLVSAEVWDTGPGVPEEMREAIFEEFRRLAPGPTGEQPGLGLGLAIVDRIARLIAAPVTVRSTLGRGSMFAIAVPRATKVSDNPSSPINEHPGDTRALAVLCLDDQTDVLTGMEALLTRWGHHVTVACELDEALAALDGFDPDLILLDYHLSGETNGLEALSALRDLCGRETPALLITANRSDEVRAAAMRASCEVLHKPLKPAALRRVLRRVSEEQVRQLSPGA